MKIEEKDLLERFLIPMGIKVGDKINIKGDAFNPYKIKADGQINSSSNISRSVGYLLGKEFEKAPRTKKQIHFELSKMAGNWKPNWKDPDQRKYEIRMHGMSAQVDYYYSGSIKSAYSVYFKTKEEVENAIKAFTYEEWKTYFGVE